ncbi:hypothetical protein [Lyngbya sp. CCY1209]|nr:hypothetical protein [Lyngbya sp. CCY1209]MEB3882844.1 hypothetical protein [Lyngbya sp. CCY1209]
MPSQLTPIAIALPAKTIQVVPEKTGIWGRMGAIALPHPRAGENRRRIGF